MRSRQMHLCMKRLPRKRLEINYQKGIEMVDLQSLVIQVCGMYSGNHEQIADRMGLTICQFNNRLRTKNGTLFFSTEQLETLQRIVGHPFLADYYAAQFGMLVVKNPVPEEMDNVELFSIQMRADAARGLVAQAKLNAEEDGIVDRNELKHVGSQVLNYMRYTAKGFIAWAALHGAQADAIELLTARKVEGYQFAASSPRCE